MKFVNQNAFTCNKTAFGLLQRLTYEGQGARVVALSSHQGQGSTSGRSLVPHIQESLPLRHATVLSSLDERRREGLISAGTICFPTTFGRPVGGGAGSTKGAWHRH